MTSEDFNKLKDYETPFIEAINKIYVKSVQGKNEMELKSFFDTPFGDYLYFVSKNIDEINQNIADIDLIKDLLEAEHPGYERLNRSNAKSSQLIRYHYENFFIRIGKVKDLFLILINRVLDLGIKKSPQMESQIFKKIIPSNPNFKVIWGHVTDQMNHLKPYRNHLAHNGTIKLEDLVVLDAYYKYDIEHKNLLEKLKHEWAMADIQREAVEKITAIISSHLDNVEQLAKMIYIFLGTPFLDRLYLLSKKHP